MSIVRAPGVNPNGRIGVRGWRHHCEPCGELGTVGTYNHARHAGHKHRKTPAHKAKVS